ncbi:MAG: S8 family peptidase [Cyclobacteriaceae bacterium]
MLRISLLIITVCLLGQRVFTQSNHYLVYFTDKTSTPYSLSNPINFLTQKAIDRRANQGYPLTGLDLPVDPAYVDSLITNGVDVRNTSDWFNAALIFADTLQADTIGQLSFVDSVQILSNYGNQLSLRKKQQQKLETAQKGTIVSSTENLPQLDMLGAYNMHKAGLKGQGITIAVIDEGFENADVMTGFDSLRANNQILGTYDFIDNETNVYDNGAHGSQVLSVIAGKDGVNNLGTAPKAFFYLFRTEQASSEYPVEEIFWLLAAEKADSLGVDIINTSLGYFDFGDEGDLDDIYFDYTYADTDGNTSLISKAARIATRTGMLLVNSAGNSGASVNKYVAMPADVDSVLSVGAVNANEMYWQLSSVGPTISGVLKPNISAMGQSTVVLDPSDGLSTANGTSFASPLIAGFAAALWQAYPTLTNMELKQAIENAGSLETHSTLVGYGIPSYCRINIDSAIVCPVEISENELFRVTNPMVEELIIHLSDEVLPAEVTLQLVDLNGKALFRANDSLTDVTNTIPLPLDKLESGLYFLQLKTPNRTETKRVIIQ